MSGAIGAVAAGKRLGPYELIRQIAVGGMAEIYLAKVSGISGFEKYVALKTIHPNYAEDEHFIELLVEEAKIVVHMTQPNIVQIFDLGRIEDIHYIAMEYVDGADLYQVMRTITEAGYELDIGTALYIAREVCAGLDYAHRCRDRFGRPLGIIHRDISPQNILLSRAGEVKLADFGIAKASLRARHTAVGVIKGKYYYMSPEQAWGDPVDQRTDIFSAGVVLYECLVGQMLYLEEDMARLIDRVRKAEIAPPSTLRPEVPPALDALVMKALARRPADRYGDAHEFQAALERFLWSYDPAYSAARLRQTVDRALQIEQGRRTFDVGGIGSQEDTAHAARARLLSREEVISLSMHSLLSVEEVAAGVTANQGNLDFDDETLVSNAPEMADLGGVGFARSPGSVPPIGPVTGPEGGVAGAWEEENATTRVARGHAGAQGGTPMAPARRGGLGGPTPGGPVALAPLPGAHVGSANGMQPPGVQGSVRSDPPSPGASVARPGSARAPAARQPGPAHPGAGRWLGNAGFAGRVAGPGASELESEADVEILEARISARRRRWMWSAGLGLGVLLLVILVAVLVSAQKMLTAPGSVELRSEPSNAAVYYQGKLVGHTPHRLDSLDPDEVHWVRLELEGCQSKKVALRVGPGKTAQVFVRLENCERGALLPGAE